MFSFDLTKEGWIPCTKTDGSSELKNLPDVLINAQYIAEISGESPPVTIALYRLFIALLYRIYRGPKNHDAWAEMFGKRSFDTETICAYFAEHSDRFDLFHEEYPFYQSPEVRQSIQKGAVIQLYFQGKNNATLFEHTTTSTPKELTPAEATRYLIAFQGFDFGGIKADGSAQTAPLLQSAIVLIRGGNLFETLMLNLHCYNGANQTPFRFEERNDLPAWERDKETTAEERWPGGPADLMTWQSRRVVFQPETNETGETVVKNSVIMRGYSFPRTVAMHEKETMMAFRKSNSGEMFSLGFNENRALWRNSLSLLQNVPDENLRPPTLDQILGLTEEEHIENRRFPIDFYGLAADKGKLLFWNHERFDLPLAFLNDHELLVDLGKCLAFAEDMGYALRTGIKTLADKLETKAETFPAVGNYWSRMEARFHLLLSNMPTDVETEMTRWFADTYKKAFAAFNATVNSLSGTAAENKSAVEAENEFRKQINIVIKKNLWDKYLPKLKSKGGNE